jgi:hypothetical protein
VEPGVVGSGIYALVRLIDDPELVAAHPLAATVASTTAPAVPRNDLTLRMTPGYRARL